MPVKIYKSSTKSFEKYLEKLRNRIEGIPVSIEKRVKKIGNQVKRLKDQAIAEFTRTFDQVDLLPEEFKVTEKEIDEAYEKVDSELLRAIRYAIKKIEEFHRNTLPSSWNKETNGVFYGQRVVPVERAGLYIPGGKGGETPLVSTVIMTAIPAKVAGVEKIVLVSPPRKTKDLHPALLVAARECGVDEVYKIGGPWAIFALAFGTEFIPKVDVICGPGNIYVTAAKKIVSGSTGIDILAGPSEVVIVADASAEPEFVAWDLLAQAEHDPMSLSVLITPEERLAKEVKKKLRECLEVTPRKDIASKALQSRGGILLTSSLWEAIELANQIAPEHLELLVKNPEIYLERVKHAGAVFLGSFTPEAMGDYIGGPNHVLPTMGLARFCSALSAEKFCKKVNFLRYSLDALKKEASMVIRMAEAENLPAHAQAVRVRLKNKA